MKQFFSFSQSVDINGNLVKRTKQTNPYSYDAFVTWRKSDNSHHDVLVYSDRLFQSNYEKYNKFAKEVFGNSGQGFTQRTPEQIEKFLQLYYSDDSIKLNVIMETCNASSGYPIWIFFFKSDKK